MKTKTQKPAAPRSKKTADAKRKGTKPEGNDADPKDAKPTMGSVMNPMMLAGTYTVDEVTAAVAKAFKITGEEDLSKLRKQIIGPRLYNVKKWAAEHGEKEPRFKGVEKTDKTEKKE